MIKECKKCGSKNLYLEPRVKGQNVLTASMVALKCKDCGIWLKWCPKDERKYYYANKQSKDKWQKLKEFIIKKQEEYQADIIEQEMQGSIPNSISFYARYNLCNEIQKKMQELEKENAES